MPDKILIKEYYENLGLNLICCNKIIRKSISPIFTKKSQKSKNIKLTEASEVITYNDKCADSFNTYFVGVLKGLKILVNEDLSGYYTDNPILAILATTRKHKRH